MLNRKKVNISPEIFDTCIHNLNETTTACIDNIEEKFKNTDRTIFGGEIKFLYDAFSQMPPEILRIFQTMRSKFTWLLRHSINVAVLSLLITGRQNYDEPEKLKILTGALLHDIGKMVIPSSILQKPASLNDEEIAVIRRHPLSGYHMIIDSAIPAESKLIVLQHHERLDGSGYPFRLKGKAISDGAKIVMVADSLDAMTSFRPYKTTQSMPKAIRSIQKDGDRYDQTLISILEQLLPKTVLSAMDPNDSRMD